MSWGYRELLYFLTLRDIKVRYKQTVLGVAWAILQPVMTMGVFSLIFGKLGKMPSASENVPYPISCFSGLVPWTFFAYGLAQCSNSLVGSQNLIKKVYFPRLVIPLSSVLSGALDFVIAFALLLIMIPIYDVMLPQSRVCPTLNVLWLPLFLILALTTSVGVGLWLSALNVEYRDVRYAVPFLIQFWMFATPIAYPSSLLDPFPFAKTLYSLNPMAGVVDGFRWALLGTKTPPEWRIVLSATSAVLLLVSGAFYFRRMERNFADVV